MNTVAGLSYLTFIPTTDYDTSISPLIFLHGMTRSKESWDDIPQAIANRSKRKAFVLDSRNHGDSEWSDILDSNQEAAELLQFMDAINIKKAIIIGHSLGGIHAMLMALIAPERIEAIIIEDMCFQSLTYTLLKATTDYINKLDDAFQCTSPQMNENEVKSCIIDYMQSPDKSGTSYQDLSSDIYLPIKRKPDGSYAAKHNSKALIKGIENVASMLSVPKCQYNGPAFFVYGDISYTNLSKYKSDIKESFPQAKFIELKHAGHEIHFSFPNEFIEIVVSCLNQIIYC